MLKLDDDQRENLRQAVRIASRHAGATTAVERVYQQVKAAVDARQPRCDATGRCCRFESYGHRLFVTTLELAHFVARVDQSPSTNWDGSGCPFQTDGLCGVHTVRPFGCRIFFCDPSAELWQQEQYETFHLAIKELHARFDTPYLYVEWREGLKAVFAGTTSSNTALTKAAHTVESSSTILRIAAYSGDAPVRS